MENKIKKILLSTLISLSIIQLSSCKKDENKIMISEVTHSLFYAPMYIAKEKGFFKEEGLDIDIITSPGVMRNVS